MSEQIELVVVTPVDVSAFIDGELGPDERADVEACVCDDDRAARLVSAWRWQLGLMHASFGRSLEEPIPPRLRLTG